MTNINKFFTVVIFIAVTLAILQPFLRTELHFHNLDVAYHYQMGKYLLHGEKPYVDFIDMNFPLIWYVSAVPALISDIVHYDREVLLLFILVCAALSFLIVKKNLYQEYGKSSLSTIMFLVTYLFAITNFWMYDLGQREYLFFVFYFPYLLNRTIEQSVTRDNTTNFLTGFIAVMGFMLKPYFVFIALVVEVVLFIRKKKILHYTSWLFRGILLGVMLAGGIILYHIEDYLHVVHYAKETYASQNAILGINPIQTILGHKLSYIIYLSVILLSISVLKKKGTIVHEIVTYVGVLSLVAAIAQSKGYDYHIKVGAAFALMSVIIACLNLLKDSTGHFVFKKHIWVYAIILLVLSRQVLSFSTLTKSYARSYEPTIVANRAFTLLENNKQCNSVYKLSTFAQPLYPAIMDCRIKDITEFNSFWFLGSFYTKEDYSNNRFSYHRHNEMGALESFFFKKVISTIVTKKPDLLVVAQPGNNFFFSVPNFDILQYYKQDERFVQFLADYEKIEHVDGHIWYRKKSLNKQ